MKMKLITCKLLTVLTLTSVIQPLMASERMNSQRVLIDPRYRATLSLEEHYAKAIKAIETKQWGEALLHFQIIIWSFPCSAYATDALYYTGIAYFHLREYEFANRQFSCYLKEETVPKFFEEVFCYKFAIAEKFRKGACKRLFGIENLPRWIRADSEAIEIYDEIATTLPNDELAPKSLYSKALLLREIQDYKGSIDTVNTLIRRYPKDSLAAAGYLLMASDYYHLSRCEPDNPDMLALALINIRRFKQDFPGDERISEAMNIYWKMEELYACGLLEMGLYYERKLHPNAAVIYYIKTIKEFPCTKAAARAKKHLCGLYEHVKCSIER